MYSLQTNLTRWYLTISTTVQHHENGLIFVSHHYYKHVILSTIIGK